MYYLSDCSNNYLHLANFKKDIKNNTILKGDCLKKMKELKDNSIDMVLCDPPYGSTKSKWDSIINLDEMWKQLKRIVKTNGVIILTTMQPFTSKLIASNPKMFRQELIWDKGKGGNFLNAKRMPLRQHENILIFGNSKSVYNPQMTKRDKPVNGKNYSSKRGDHSYGNSKPMKKRNTYTHKYPTSILKFGNNVQKGKYHPTQKPIDLFEYLIKTYSNKGDVILDFTVGSGTTAIAAINTGRKYIGIEKDENYYKISKNRIKKLNKKQ